MKNDNNRSKQLNPQTREFLNSRGCNLTKEDVSRIQMEEVRSKGMQSKDGVGAEAQRRLESIEKGTCSLS